MQDANEGLIASWGSGKINHDRAVLMAGAFVQLGERILSELQCGDFRYQVVIGTEGTFFGVRLSDNQDVLSMCFNKFKSLDNLIRALDTNLEGLNTALSFEGYNIIGEIERSSTTSRTKMMGISLEQFSIQPREIEVISVDGLTIAGVLIPQRLERMRYEEDRMSPMACAGLSLGERISSEMGNGILEEVIIYGTKGTFILTAVGEEAVLAAIYDKVVSLDRLRSQLQDVANAVAQWI